MKAHIFNIILVILLVLFYSGVSPYIISSAYFILVVNQIIYKFGKGIILMELIMFFSGLTYLLMPMLGYTIYTKTNKLIILWDKAMPIPEDVYFDFFLPSILVFSIGLYWHFSTNTPIDSGTYIKERVDDIKLKLKNALNIGITIASVGIAFYFINKFVSSFGYLGTLGYFMLFPGIMYVYFTPKNNLKYIFMAIFASFIIFDALQTGMFTIIVYMGATMFSVALLGQNIKYYVKLLTLAFSIFFIFIVQGVKSSVRNVKSVTNTFSFSSQSDVEKLLTPDGFFPMYVRFNQGFLGAKVLEYIPKKSNFDNGNSITNALLASVIPRIFWPDKPESGGVYNIKRFIGLNLKGYSMNIGPPAEAYGNFGVTGGILFMLFFGILIRFFYIKIIKLSQKNSLLILWLPITFFQVIYCMENDVMQALNSLFKGSLFIYVLSKLAPSFFNLKVKESFK